VARDRATLAEAARHGPAARLADAPWGTIYRWFAA